MVTIVGVLRTIAYWWQRPSHRLSPWMDLKGGDLYYMEWWGASHRHDSWDSVGVRLATAASCHKLTPERWESESTTAWYTIKMMASTSLPGDRLGEPGHGAARASTIWL